ncbi:MAG TPA: metalloenzyme [Firmicutes bacterium]|nr:metalloenzyme [Bacillota bacterium]HOQ24581.1 alkaline phosphatase family protein [Bacillota bacterium]HPT67835.1 alkaline phosphatase family protein [Bacillota bacterium]
MRVALVFIDGFGLGEADPEINPLAWDGSFFHSWLGQPLTRQGIGAGRMAPGLVVVPTDACLGVEGLPQSATGQTSLFTGVNAQKAVGHHVNGFPTAALRRILQEKGIFARLAGTGKRAVFANAFTTEYLRAVQEGRVRASATTVAAQAGDQPLRLVDKLLAGQAVYQDLTRKGLVERGIVPETISPVQAGRDLATIINANDFTLFEYFQTDRCGHKQNKSWARQILEDFGLFFQELLAGLEPAETLLVVTSDHGNFEALDRKAHTLNPVPTIAWGAAAAEFTTVRCLTDILPRILRVLQVPME